AILRLSQVLLMSDVSVCRDEYIEAGCFRGVQQFAVLQRVPSTSPRLLDGVIGERRGNTSRGPIVEENAHQRWAAGASRLRAANSSTALTCSRVTGNCSITSSMVIPSSRFSKTTATGVRVPLNTQAPLTLPGTLSTAGHSDQSRAAMHRPPSDSSLRDIGRAVIRRQAAARMTSSCRNQLTTRFQLAKFRVIFPCFGCLASPCERHLARPDARYRAYTA